MSEPEPERESPPWQGLCGQPKRHDQGVVLGVFGKHWTPGATKTRLAATIGPEAAAAASQMFLETTLTRLGEVEPERHRRVLAYSPSDSVGDFERLVSVVPGDWRLAPQVAGDLGGRMAAFFAAALQTAPAALLVGSDSPHLPIQAVAHSTRWLGDPSAGRRVVLGPTNDGGYWLIGARGAVPPIFEGMPWSEPWLLDATLQRLAEKEWNEGADYHLATRWYDIDDEGDLLRMRTNDLTADEALQSLASRLDELLGSLDP